eukprot:comp21617_c0_seq1/m.47672 comp21617_c0_seq1/g.47672  ORF comp21617_c0_seq1/g.47672 comp21617_c0_seq1/m.47672 type:complete len:610 (-) comp21617_c0_seq1:122-1951(-)
MVLLKELTKNRLMDEMIKAVQPASGWKVLIVDKVTVRIISSCARMYDIMENGVTLVEGVEKARQGLPNVEAIYFLSPCNESISQLIADYKDPKKPKYGDVHLFFSTHLEDTLFARLKGSAVVERIRTFKELNIDYLAVESQVFSLDRGLRGFYHLYSSKSQETQDELRKVSLQLASVLVTINEFPYIRYANKGPCQRVADIVFSHLTALKTKSPEYAKSVRDPRATLIIVDRSVDPLPLFLHDFYYQAMAYDNLQIDGEQFKYKYVNNAGKEEEKDVLLNEYDKIWPTVRHMFIADCIQQLQDNFNEFLKNNKAANLQKGQVSDLKEMSEAVRAMPQYKELLAKYSVHIYIASELMAMFNRTGLEQIANAEQNLAMGEDSNGAKLKNVTSLISPLLSNASVSLENKLRLIMIYIITQEGIKDADRHLLMRTANVQAEQQAVVANLSQIGVRITRGSKESKKKASKPKQTRKSDDVPYDLARYEPYVKTLLTDVAENNLKGDEFPYFRDAPAAGASTAAPGAGAKSLRTVKHKWADNRKGKGGEDENTNPRVILFVLGGITHSEMRVAYEVAQATNHDIFIGGTDIMAPKQWLTAIGNLDKTADSLGFGF